MSKITPLMKQYYEIKALYPDTLLLFQVGDFYELFSEDAQVAAPFLGITLTKRGTDPHGNPIPLAGVPVHVLDCYITKLVKGGFKVAVCDQLEPARPGRVVQRGVTQVLTPGTLTDTNLLDSKSASYLAVFFPTNEGWTLLFAEILTGHIVGTLIKSKSASILESELSRFMPDEIVVPKIKLSNTFSAQFKSLGYPVSEQDFSLSNEMHTQEFYQWMEGRFSEHILNLIKQSSLLRSGLHILYAYLNKNNPAALSYFKQLLIYNPEDYLMLDANTIKNLELVKNLQDASSSHTLFSVIDEAITPMGSRTLKKWLLRPLVKQELIEERLDVIEYLINHLDTKSKLEKILQAVGDIERIVGRIALKRALLYDYKMLKNALSYAPSFKSILHSIEDNALIKKIGAQLGNFTDLVNFLESSINDDETNEWLVKPGFDKELDHLRSLVEHGSQAILNLEYKEQQRTGINSLKIRYNQVHGFGIEITKANIHLVPDDYMRIQTLAQRERFTTQALKDLEYDLLRARNEINDIEKKLFDAIKSHVETYLGSLKKYSQAVAHMDALIGLSQVAYSSNYIRPTFNEKNIIIKEGKHPVIAARLHDKFIANDTQLTEDESLWLITGPNMGGKSTYLRQTALICIMAQMGSFVPACKADIPLLDRVFTRIGAADNVAEGKSTFLVEMEETALICNQATRKSLVILDEVGRGTSTFDGLAIAQAVVEYIYEHLKARCLFATHYHELSELPEKFPGIVSYHAASKKTEEGVILLHKILPGVASGSFGLEVAKLALLPESIIERASSILSAFMTKNNAFENKSYSEHGDTTCTSDSKRIKYLEDFSARFSIIAQQLDSLDCDNITPKQALDIICDLKNKAQCIDLKEL